MQKNGRLVAFVREKTNEQLDEKDREAFIRDVFEDFKEMRPSRIAGLGITVQQMNDWINAQ